MVAAVSGVASDPQNLKTTAAASASQDKHSKRPPLLPSEKDNNQNNQRKPKSRVVSSRYMSPSTSSTSSSNSSSISYSSSSSSSLSASRRFPSPSISRNSSNPPSVGPKRSVSVDRRRRAASPAVARPLLPDLDSKNRNAAVISAAAKLLVTSTRSLSVSFQGEAFSLPISKTKEAPHLPILRKGTPERRRSNTPSRGDHVENSKPSDQNHHNHHRWPARNRLSSSSALSRSLDCSGSGVGDNKSKLIKGLQRSLIIVQKSPDSVVNESSVTCDLIPSDSDSVSSDSISGVQECGSNGPRSIAVSARFWQETNSRLRRLQDRGSPLSTSPGSKPIVLPKSKRYSSDSPLSSPRTISSPGHGATRPASPGKLMGLSPLRAHSPSRIRKTVSMICNNFQETPSVLSFAVDVQRGKAGENRLVDAHLLRLMYNRQLQWRFVNARTEAVLIGQRRSVEKNLWNAWIAISDLRDTLTKKRHRLQLLRQKLKLASILRGHMALFEDWASLEKDHSVSLFGAIGSLKASTLRLPVVGGAIANVQSLTDATGSAVDVMQAMAPSICSLLPIVEEVNSLVSELVKVTAKERCLLEQCTDFISLLASMQVKDSSLRTHIIQHNCITSPP